MSKKSVCWDPKANSRLSVSLDICSKFFRCVWQFPITLMGSCQVITQPANSMYMTEQTGTAIQIWQLAGEKGSKPPFFFPLLRGENNVFHSSSTPAIIIGHRKPLKPTSRNTATENLAEPSKAQSTKMTFSKLKKKKKLMKSTDSHLPRIFNSLPFRH